VGVRAFFALLSLATLLLLVGSARGQQAGLAPTQRVMDHDYIGADRCRACHAEEYAAWEKSPHARSLDSLSERDRADPRCLSCHTMVPDDLTAGLLGVQCESCHGGGRHYALDYVMRDAELRQKLNFVAPVDEARCTRCHTENSPALGKFSHAEKRELIRHWKDAK
jgi:hypothetical protein